MSSSPSEGASHNSTEYQSHHTRPNDGVLSTMNRPVFRIGGMVFTAVAVLFAGKKMAQLSVQRNTATEARNAEAPAPRTIFANGAIEGQTREIELSFENAGRVQKVDVKEGDPVKPGDVLATQDDASALQELAKAEAALEIKRAEKDLLLKGARPETRAIAAQDVRIAEIQRDQAQRTFDRMEPLHDAVTPQDLDDSSFAVQRAKAELQVALARTDEVNADARKEDIDVADHNIKVAEERVAAANIQLEKTRLRAPSDGTILKVNIREGELSNDQRTGLPRILLTMADLKELRVRAHVEQWNAREEMIGMRVTFTAVSLPDYRFIGTIIRSAPFMEKNGTGQRMRAVVIRPDPDQEGLSALLVGMPVDVSIQPATAAL